VDNTNSQMNPLPLNRPVDGLERWDAEAPPGGPGELPVVRPDGNERLLLPFTTAMLQAVLHYLEYPSVRGYLHCNQGDCLLCRIGRQADPRCLWPVYDYIGRFVAVLPVSDNQRPQALRPQLMPVLRRLKAGGEPFLIGLRKHDAGQFRLSMLPLPAGADDGAAVIKAFQERLESGALDLGVAYRRLANADLAAIPEVAAEMRARGIAAA
jgi:hypothetical protein